MLDEQIEHEVRALPVLGLWVLYLRIDDLERAGERQTDAADDAWQGSQHVITVVPIELWPTPKWIEQRRQPELLVQLSKSADTLLQTFGDGQIPGLDDVAIIGASGRSSPTSPSAASPATGAPRMERAPRAMSAARLWFGCRGEVD